MNTPFAAAMRQASQQTRGRNLVEATRLIQDALNGRAHQEDQAAPGAFKSLPGAGKTLPGDFSPRPAPSPLPDDFAATLGARLAGLNPSGAFSPGGLPCMGSVGLGSAGRPSGVAAPLPEGAQFLTRSFACAAGSRSYKLYVPASAPKPRGLVVMLHGCTQDPDDFAAGTGMNAVAEAHGFAVAYPGQTRAHNATSCWNWFDPKDQRRDAGEPAIIAGLTREIVAAFGIDPSRVFVAGLSAGGAMAAVMGEAYPDVYSGVGVHSGLAAGAARDVASAFAAMQGKTTAGRDAARPGPRVRTIVFHGTADRTVAPSNAERVVARATPDAASISTARVAGQGGRRGSTRTVTADPAGEVAVELWIVDGAGHAWSGGRPGGSYVDPTGPDASAEMMRFFLGETAPATA